jgi:hypothetical protein
MHGEEKATSSFLQAAGLVVEEVRKGGVDTRGRR